MKEENRFAKYSETNTEILSVLKLQNFEETLLPGMKNCFHEKDKTAL